MRLSQILRVTLIAGIWISAVVVCNGAGPTIMAPPGGSSYVSDATFDVTLSGTAGAAVTAGVWDVGESGFVESLNGTLGSGMQNMVTLKFNDYTPRNEWDMDDPPGTPAPYNAQIRACYQSNPNDYLSIGININQ